MQTIVYIIGGYCLIKAVLAEILSLIYHKQTPSEAKRAVHTMTAFLFLAAIEAFNQ